MKVVLYIVLLLAFTANRLFSKNDQVTGFFVNQDSGNVISGLFSSEEIMDISISFDLTSYLRKSAAGRSQKGIVMMRSVNGDSVYMQAGISSRGYFRQERCTMAPVEISFRSPVFAYRDSGEILKIKLVSVCDFNQKSDEYVLREYLVYRMYNALTDSSYRVRLLRVKFIDTMRDRKPVTVFGFFIEPKAIMASRLHAVAIKNMNLTQKYVDLLTMDRVSLFNYMAGNWDWAVQSLHNITILKSLDYNPDDLAVAVPYDFDLTGVVDPYYNMPPSSTGLKSNRDRKYMGMCRSENVFREELSWFSTKKEKIFSVVNNFQLLSPRARQDIIEYLNSFFIQLEKPKSTENLISSFRESCLRL